MKKNVIMIIGTIVSLHSFSQTYLLFEELKREEGTRNIEYVKEYHETDINAVDLFIGKELVVVNFINSLGEICGKEIVRIEIEKPTEHSNNTIFGKNTQGEHVLISFCKNEMILIDYSSSFENEDDIYKSIFFYKNH